MANSGRESSDSESSDTTMDERPDSLQDVQSSLKIQPSSLAADSEKAVGPVEARCCEEGSPKAGGQASDGPKSTQGQKLKTAPADNLPQQPPPQDDKSMTSQSGPGKKSKATNYAEQNPDSKKKKDITKTKQPVLDQNANVELNASQTGQTKQKRKNEPIQKPKAAPPAVQQMVFGPQKHSQVKKFLEHPWKVIGRDTQKLLFNAFGREVRVCIYMLNAAF